MLSSQTESQKNDQRVKHVQYLDDAVPVDFSKAKMFIFAQSFTVCNVNNLCILV